MAGAGSCANCAESVGVEASEFLISNHGHTDSIHEQGQQQGSSSEIYDDEPKPILITIQQALKELFDYPEPEVLQPMGSGSGSGWVVDNNGGSITVTTRMCGKCTALIATLYQTLTQLVQLSKMAHDNDKRILRSNHVGKGVNLAGGVLGQFLAGLSRPSRDSADKAHEYEPTNAGRVGLEVNNRNYDVSSPTPSFSRMSPEDNKYPEVEQLLLLEERQGDFTNWTSEAEFEVQLQRPNPELLVAETATNFIVANRLASDNHHHHQQGFILNSNPCRLRNPATGLCRLGKSCHLFSMDQRQRIHDRFWSLPNLAEKKKYVNKLVDVIPVKNPNRSIQNSRRKSTFVCHFFKEEEDERQRRQEQAVVAADLGLSLSQDTDTEAPPGRIHVCGEMFRQTLDISKKQFQSWNPRLESTDSGQPGTVAVVAAAEVPAPGQLRKRYRKKPKYVPPRIASSPDLLPSKNLPFVALRQSDRITVLEASQTQQLESPEFKSSKPKSKNLKPSHCLNLFQRECPDCHHIFDYSWSLERHQLAIHQRIPPQTCHLCRFQSYHHVKDAGHFNAHICKPFSQPEAPEPSRFRCDFCGKHLTSANALKFHCWTHDNTRVDLSTTVLRFPCPRCPKSFKLLVYLTNHIKRFHEYKEKIPKVRAMVQCPSCDSVLRKHSLKTHMERLHGGPREERPFSCEICGAAFRFSNALNVHVKRVHFGHYKGQCTECGMVMHAGHLRIHMERWHNPDKPSRRSLKVGGGTTDKKQGGIQ